MADQSTSPFFAIKGPSEGFLKDRGSKFYAFAFPVETDEEIELHVLAVKKRFHDARHHCVAYRIGLKGEQIYSTDDGEPGNSAGPPILAAIRSANLTNVLIVVVRYFGGTKLGIRGLIEAYRGAAEAAIEEAEVFEIIPKVTFTLYFEYPQTAEVNRILHKFETEQLSANYTDTCQLTLSIREPIFPTLENMFHQSRIRLEIELA